MKIIKSYEKMDCTDVMQCIFNLNDLDILVFKTLTEIEEARVKELAKKLKKERSTIYRSLQRLTECGLSKKHTKNLNEGGYYHVYKNCNQDQLVETMESCIDDWYKHMKTKIKDIKKIH